MASVFNQNLAFSFFFSFNLGHCKNKQLNKVCCCCVAKSCLTLCHPMYCSIPGSPVLHYLPEFVLIHVHLVNKVSNHFILYLPLLLLPSIFPSIRVFSSASTLHFKWSKYWRFSFSISPHVEYAGLIPFRIDWFDLLAVQGILKRFFQHHSSKASILQCSSFMVQVSHPYMTIGKITALIIWSCVDKVSVI